MSYENQCTYTNKLSRINCGQCQRRFKMQGSCCLDLCGDHERCRGCENGTRSKEYKEWRKENGK